MFAVTYSFAVRPFTNRSMNYLDIVNESTIMIVAYATIPYSDYLLDPYFKYDIGWVVIFVFLANLACNISFIFASTLVNLYKKLKKLKRKK